MKNFFKKSIISALLAITIFYAAAPALSSISGDGFSGFTGTVYAAEDGISDNKDNVTAKSPCHSKLGFGIFTGDCARWVIAQIIYNLVFRTTNYITYLTGTIFDTAIGFSINGDIYKVGVDENGKISGNAMIGEGWELLRDFANIFFIFVILYIAISVILQVGTYGGKDLLVKVIITAILVNFSLMITQTIVDASHVFAWNFYSKLNSEEFLRGGVIDDDGTEGDDVRKAKGIPRDMKVSNDYDAIGMSDIFMRAFNPQKMFVSSNKIDDEMETVQGNFETIGGVKDGITPSKSFLDSIWQIIMVLILSSVLNLIIAFIFIAVSVMFIIRVVVLWMVMMAAPIAFLSMILPGMKKISSMWWNALIGQALFAPIFLFLFYLVAKLISNEFVQKLVTEADNAPAAKVGFVNLSSTIVVFFHFAIFGALLIGILYIAKSLSVAGAGEMMKAGNKTSNWARNKFGDKAAWRGGKYGGRRMAGLAGEGLLRAQRNADGSQNRFGKAIGTIPLVNRGFAAASSWREKQIKGEEESRKKKFGSYSDAGLTAMKGQVFTKSAGKTIEGIEKKRSAETEKKKRIEAEKEELNNLRTVQSNASVAKDKLKEEIEKIEEVLGGFETDLVTQNYKLAKAINDGGKQGKIDEGLALTAIDGIKEARAKRNVEKKIREGYIKQIEKEEARKKELEDKEERRKETEGLQSAIKSSSGSSSSSGGSKNP